MYDGLKSSIARDVIQNMELLNSCTLMRVKKSHIQTEKLVLHKWNTYYVSDINWFISCTSS